MDLSAYSFASCRDFLESPQLHNASCIIADVQMPEMSGLELQRIIKSRGLTAPLIFITAYPDDKIRKQALDEARSVSWTSPSEEPQSSSALKERSSGTAMLRQNNRDDWPIDLRNAK